MEVRWDLRNRSLKEILQVGVWGVQEVQAARLGCAALLDRMGFRLS